ncbi:DUF2855 family protein [Psychrobacter sp. DAB_AL43B]|uniref:DUF2855 family protein n=1 Tax=Psychrobacter sp. DAB_AL43B TaxID=1028416 RepID=UPI0009A85102|nr:DUF2855 family protein [Psychrobacter sp. DAB_AL43B]SLJ84649.1 hypothetical protein DABAL43B_1453 [Psychrobacter sp. DAB_AL43B]
MQEFQTNKEDITQSRLIQAPINTVNDGEVLVKVDRFAFTANNITYAAMGDQLQYWQFFPPHGEDAKKWGIIPVWGFADVIESNNTELRVGERLFGYFPPANELVIKPMRVTPASLTDGSAHRAQLPPTYNMYQRVKHEPGYDRANDNQRMLLFPLHMASFCLYDLLKSNDWFGAEQVVIISASSKTSTGLAYGLADDKDAPHVIGLTSDHHLDFVNSIGAYDSALSYDNLEQIDASKPTVIVDMSANADLLSQLHMHLGDNMRYTSNVGLTHWDESRSADGIIKERSHQFFAPSHMQQRMKEWGVDEFNKRSTSYIMKSAAKTVPWLKIKELDGLNSLEDTYQDICDGKIGPDEGLVVVM